jgi:hypothetical protein
MPDYRPIARRYARQYGIPENIFLAMGGQESGGRQTKNGRIVTSPAGALGWGQLMPATAKGLGVDPHDPDDNIRGAAMYLSQQYRTFGSWRLALAAYNAGPNAVKTGKWLGYDETTRYVKNVLAMAGDTKPGAVTAQARVAAAAPGPATLEPGGSAPPPDLSGLALQNLASVGTRQFDPVGQLSNLTMAVAASRTAPPVAAAPDEATAPSAPANAKTSAAPKDWQKWVVVPPARGNTSDPHKPLILQFVAGIAQGYGKPLAVWDNTTHSRTTVNGNLSAHGPGNAADIPARGAKLKRLGYIALVRAGMSVKEARAASRKGGLFNVGGYQVIFSTNVGGNHYDHLHVGIRG